MSNWRDDVDWSANAFLNITWPVIQESLGGGELFSLEDIANDSTLSRMFDIGAGVDAVQVLPNGRGFRSIAQRCQQRPPGTNGRYPWPSFTIRKWRESGMTTECEKRDAAIAGNYLYPNITVQTYLETKEGPYLQISVAETKDIFDIINDPTKGKSCTEREVTENGRKVKFIAVWWSLFAPEKLTVYRNPDIYPPKVEVTKDPVLNRPQLDLF